MANLNKIDRKGRKKYPGMGDWYPEREPPELTIEENIINSVTDPEYREIQQDIYSESMQGVLGLEDDIASFPMALQPADPEPENISEERKEFDKLAFAEKLYLVRDKTQERLEKEFPNQNMEVKIGELGRSLETQQEYLKKGSTGTSLSLHNLDAAADYQIFVNGEYQHAKGRDIDYYRILGDVAQKEGLFWGWGDDPGHVGYDEFVSDIVEDYPSLSEEPVIKRWWSEREDEANLMYQPTLELLDSLYDESPERQYIGDETREEKMAKRVMLTGIPEPTETVKAKPVEFDLSIFGK